MCPVETHRMDSRALEDLRSGSEFFRKEFPPTDFVCNSMGDLIHFDGPYDEEKHKAAWERAKKWMLVKGRWVSKPGMRPFRRLYGVDPSKYRAFERQRTFNFSSRVHHEEGWTGGLPPVCVGMLGTYKGKRAVVVGKEERVEMVECHIGIGDAECMFKDYESENHIVHFGVKTLPTIRVYWKVMTPSCDVMLPRGSSVFHRSTRVVRNFEDRGVFRALKHIVDPITVPLEASSPAPKLKSIELKS